jgi:hypothetical protein
MQHGRSEAGFPRTSAFLGLRSHKSFLPAQVTLGCAPRPLPTPPPRVRPRYQHIPVAARTKHTGAGQPRRGDAQGPGTSQALGRAGQGRAAKSGGRRREKHCRPGRPRGGRQAGGTEGETGGAGEDGRGQGGAAARLGSQLGGRTRPKLPPAHPHPHPRASERKSNWGQGAEPGSD